MNLKNFQSQAENNERMQEKESFLSATKRTIRSYASRITLGTAILLGGEAIKDSNVYGQVPARTTAAAMKTSGESESVETPPLTKEQEEMEIQRLKMEIQTSMSYYYSRLDTLKDQARIMHARTMVPKLMAKLRTASSDYELIALYQMIFDVASIAGRADESLVANQALTPDSDQHTYAFFGKEVEILKALKQNPLNAKAITIQRQMDAEIQEREAVMAAMDHLLQAPDDADTQQKLGEYLFFECASDKGLAHLAKGTNELHRYLALMPNDAMVWMEGSEKETDSKRKIRMQLYALSLYDRDPSAYAEHQPLFQAKSKAFSTILAAEPPKIRRSVGPQVATVSSIDTPTAAEQTASALEGNRILEPLRMMDPKEYRMKVTPDGKVLVGGQGNSPTLKIPLVPVGSYGVSMRFEQEGDLMFLVLPVGNGELIIRKSEKSISFGQNDGTKPSFFKNATQMEFADPTQLDISVVQNTDGTYTVTLNAEGKEIGTLDFNDIAIDPSKGQKWFYDGQHMGVNIFRTQVKIHSFAVSVGQIKPGVTVKN